MNVCYAIEGCIKEHNNKILLTQGKNRKAYIIFLMYTEHSIVA